MSISSKENRARRLKAQAVAGSNIRAAANKGRMDGLAQRADLSNPPCHHIEYWHLNKANKAYRNARDAAIMKN